MNRRVCVLSTFQGEPYIVACNYRDGRLLVGHAKKIKPDIKEEQGKTVVINSIPTNTLKTLQEYKKKGFSVYVDEAVVRYSRDYQHTSLFEPEMLTGAFKCYLDLHKNNAIKFNDGVKAINCSSSLETVIDETGKTIYRVNSETLDSSKTAFLVACYYVLNVGLNDIDYLKQLNQERRKLRFRSRGKS